MNGLNSALLNKNPNLNPADGASASNPFRLDTSSGGNEVMGYFDGNTVTGLWNYDQHFAMSDNSFGTSLVPPLPD
jgi:phospholipase C